MFTKKPEDVNILVIGDIMLDRYIVGKVNKISPEAPVPVVEVTKEYSTLGGCGNVVANLRELGTNVKVIARVGKDRTAKDIRKHLFDVGATYNLIEFDDIITTQKLRVIADYREMQMLRIDRESIEERSFVYLFESDKYYDLIIVSDYAKGMITERLMTALKKLEIPIIIDPKPQHILMYGDVFMITPNKRELSEINRYGLVLETSYILETRGKNGMILHDRIQEKQYKIKGKPVECYNVTGAGDSVISALSTCIAMGINVLDAAKISNKCAQFVVTQPGTSTIPKKIFEKECLKIKRFKEMMGG